MNSRPEASKDHTPVSRKSDYIPLFRFWQPRYWGLWAGIGLLRLLVMLPFRRQVALGRLLGRLAFLFMPKRRRIAETNLRICFPGLADNDLRQLVRDHVDSLGFSLFEIGLALWASQAQVERLVSVRGLEHLTATLDDGHGVVLVSGHFPAGELVGRAIPYVRDVSAGMYRPLGNPLIDQLLRRARHRVVAQLIPKANVRQLIRLLRNGSAVWYASDQSYDRANAVLVPFFGEPAMTNPALSHIAKMGRARVVPFFQRRLRDGGGYEVVFFPPLEDFPTDDHAADAARINDWLADCIRQAPEQYYWVHRRFKNRPEGWPDPYEKA